ncbi:uncharacterized protein [Gossypium hirsutum]|uniref:Reverse transcriptase zinc-binding domain-containing protein n=1 Tax=Gossypium hirsutum TaxID=3635 RepID=A0ABM2Z4W4_GOSHI|nr:uncharacterized protein LOC121209907 [Gossypium hirsutum]
MHWCEWGKQCKLKEDEGLGFRSFAKFNVALLAKQGSVLYVEKYLGSEEDITRWSVLKDRILRIPLTKIPHNDGLMWRGEPSGTAICPRCRDGVETLAHVFRSCPVANEV